MRKLVAVAVTVLAVTACGSNGPTAGTAVAPRCDGTGADRSTANAVDDTTGIVAAGKQLPPDAMLVAVGATGEALIESGRSDIPGTGGAPTTLRPGTLAVVDPATGRRQEIRTKKDLQPGTQTVFGAVDRDHVVWLQEHDTSPNLSTWSLYSADRRSGKIRLVATARPVDGKGLKPTVPGYTIPQLHAGTVYWAGARPATVAGKAPGVDISARRVDGSAPEKLVVPNAILPVVTGSWLYYAEFDGAHADRPGYRIHRQSLRTGQTELVRRMDTGPGIAYLAADGDTVAWGLDDGTVEVSRSVPVDPVKITGTEGEQLGWLSAGSGLVGFADAGGEARGAYLFDVRRGCLHSLAAAGAAGTDAVVSGHTIAWTVDNGPDRLRWQLATRPPEER